MRYALLPLLLLLLQVGRPGRVLGQERSDSVAEELTHFARAYVAISRARDEIQAELAEPKNKKDEEQSKLREKLRTRIAEVLREHKLTPARYEHLTWEISADTARRRAFDSAVASVSVRKPDGAPSRPPPRGR